MLSAKKPVKTPKSVAKSTHQPQIYFFDSTTGTLGQIENWLAQHSREGWTLIKIEWNTASFSNLAVTALFSRPAK